MKHAAYKKVNRANARNGKGVGVVGGTVSDQRCRFVLVCAEKRTQLHIKVLCK